jgi:putative ABC transport system permease protein
MGWIRYFRRKHWDAERSSEIENYLEIEIAENVARGMAPDEARYAAHRKLGNSTLVREEIYRMNSIGFLETLWKDVHYTQRMLKRNPGFTLLAVLSLAIGIGGNAAMFSVVSAVLIRPLPYRNPGRLLQTNDYYPKGALAAFQQQSRTMELAGFTTDTDLNLTGQGKAQHLAASEVSANVFSVLGVGTELGRAFRAGENTPGRDDLVILSHALWQNRFSSDPEIIGRSIKLEGIDREVVGVMPPGFGFPNRGVELWIPLHMDPRASEAYWGTGYMQLIARLRPGASIQQAKSEIRSLTAAVIPLFPFPMGRDWNSDATVLPLKQYLVSDVRVKLLVLQCAIGLVLLIACANVASLLLARAASRQKEIALRAALGAGRARIARQLLTESVALALAGGGLGFVLAFSGLSALKLALPVNSPGWAEIHMGWPVLLFITVLSILTGLAFGLAPALSAARQDLASTIRAGGRRSSGAPGARLRSALIAGEVALAFLLAIGAGLLIKSLWLLTQVNPGFTTEHILTLRVTPNESLCSTRSACVAFYDELLRRARGINGVSDVAAANVLPLSDEVPMVPVDLEGHPRIPSQNVAPLLWAGAVTPRYFRIMQIRILEGRGFTDSDSAQSAPVVLVSAATARKYWPGEDAIGKHIRPVWDQAWRTVVGVAEDVRQYDLAGHSPSILSGAVYMPYAQAIDVSERIPIEMTLIVRTGSDPATIAARISDLVAGINPDVPVSAVQTMDEVVNASTAQPRSMMWLFVIFAGVALLLAAVGTYGVISYSTSQRTFEIGIRVALGATRTNIFGLILRQSLQLVLAGLAIGFVAALALVHLLNSFLYGITPTDPLTFLAVCALLVVIGLLAGFVPARRAATVDPLTALRMD